MTMTFGIDRLLADPALRKPLEGKRVALLAHPASVTADLTHSLDALAALGALAEAPARALARLRIGSPRLPTRTLELPDVPLA